MFVEPPIEFNHFYITLASATLEAIAQSGFIAQAFSMVRQTVQTDESSWTGTYLFGKRTYLELFAPGGAADVREGDAGIGFSPQRLGQIDPIEEALKSRTPERLSRHLHYRHTEQGKVPWFHNLHIVPSEEQHFTAWLMDFHPDYLKIENIQRTALGLFDREAYLATRRNSDSLLDDILEVHLELSAEEWGVLDPLLNTFGFCISRVGNTTLYRSAAFTLRVSSVSTPSYRVRKVICSMTAPSPQAQAYVFGDDAQLTVEGSLMVWRFGPVDEFGCSPGAAEGNE